MTPEEVALRDRKRQLRGQILEALAMFRERALPSVTFNQLEALVRNARRDEIEFHVGVLIELGYVEDAAPATNARERHEVSQVCITASGLKLVDGFTSDDGVKFGL